MENKMRKRIFGYSKKDVTGYVENLISDYEKKIDEIMGDLKDERNKSQALMAQNAELFDKNFKLEAEKAVITETMISAEQCAKKIIDDAKTEAENLKQEKLAEIEELVKKAEALKEEIKTIKLGAVATVRKYETELDRIMKK